ncbi:nucleoside deaminase [Antarcticirhabdus aurantiaca]|uniref:Nucleoside deaminase n=2 Tax=Antarcticirhabdus aurantiaca TaxID=2606717 RepID=A0ACD4NXP7_9HYPH|nr:nucleoside deaminase [Antarcticirhabdus aurantiaca]WAJ31541.1 nucleoside deaminase [Jeongeuplla avenae]
MQEMGDKELDWLRHAIGLARQARARGDHPFGAVLLGPEGELLLEAMNSCGTEGDRTGHAERNLMSEATKRFDADFMKRRTMVTSAEPCAMCAGAAYWAGLGRVVYGLSEQALKDLIGPHPENLTMDLPCRDVFAAGQRDIEVRGPLLESEAAGVHEGFWR